jgi:hypothetical protein
MNRTTIILFVFSAFFMGCHSKKDEHVKSLKPIPFNPNELTIKESNTTKKVRGQILYLPVYSNVPHFENRHLYDLSGFVTLHNTDFYSPIKITNVLYFDNDGNLVKKFLDKERVLKPLAATNFFIPESDQSGTGANFIIEWVSDTLVSEPLIESVMLGLSSGQGVSFLSTGRIVREVK